MSSRMKLAAIWAAAAAMLFSGQEAALLQASRQHQLRPKGRVKTKRSGKPRSERPNVVHCRAAHDRPIRYAQLSPTINGVRMRWDADRLVPRDSQSARPWTKRKQERALAKKLRRKAELQQGQPPVKHIPKGTWFRGDMKGAMRAARRAGVISARQQRRLNKAGRAQS